MRATYIQDSNSKSALSALGSNIIHRIDSMQSEVVTLISQKDELENELSSSILQRNMLSSDLQSLVSEHEVLKGAYQAVEYDLASLQQRQHDGGTQGKELILAKEKISELATDLAMSLRKVMELEKGAELVVQLTAKVATVQESNCDLEAKLREATISIEMHKATAETLKKKLKELGTGDARDFMDSFEEVMRDEMMSMKIAFENKLKMAKEDAEISSRRHQHAIQQLMSLSPSSSQTYLNVPKGASLR